MFISLVLKYITVWQSQITSHQRVGLLGGRGREVVDETVGKEAQERRRKKRVEKRVGEKETEEV